MDQHPRIVVIGAGAFGGWTALELRRRGAQVTVIDGWGPGNLRASSGGETRVIRLTYGTRAHYTRLTMRALTKWRELEDRIERRILHQTGVLWLFGPSAEAHAFASASADALRAQGAVFDEISADEARRRYPQIDFGDVATIMFEPNAGYLLARRACEHVVEALHEQRGVYRLGAAAAPVDVGKLRAGRLTLTDGSVLDADAFVFACGPWLGSLFPDAIGRRIIATRQEVYYFGTPAGDSRFTERELPAWIDLASKPPPSSGGLERFYGIPGNGHRGFKLADDVAGQELDPSTADRDPSAAGIAAARGFLRRRFPALSAAPLIGSEVCQYEATPDSDLIIDRHPDADTVWIVGGGSGHGFKMGPAIGELVASMVLDTAPIDSRFALSRFATPPAQGWQGKWT